jgi:hypothetical protein
LSELIQEQGGAPDAHARFGGIGDPRRGDDETTTVLTAVPRMRFTRPMPARLAWARRRVDALAEIAKPFFDLSTRGINHHVRPIVDFIQQSCRELFLSGDAAPNLPM